MKPGRGAGATGEDWLVIRGEEIGSGFACFPRANWLRGDVSLKTRGCIYLKQGPLLSN